MFNRVLTARRVIVTVSFLVFNLSLVAKTPIRYDKKELRLLMQQAKTPTDYERLAVYFSNEVSAYRAKAQADEDLYQSSLRTISEPKYPSAADTAAWRRKRDLEKARQMERFASFYREKTGQTDKTKQTTSQLQLGPAAAKQSDKPLTERVERLEQEVRDMQKQ